jgi:hypothetical protein
MMKHDKNDKNDKNEKNDKNDISLLGLLVLRVYEWHMIIRICFKKKKIPTKIIGIVGNNGFN